ncbi:hypothetical protein L6452_22419 [Arctium lappa]|uniref:Uncharacterized protein n=1 Tax=Arctium lappa TaxID=4217 RepID=A0ACB9B027_ARCLA|nr:hypothetical protein L6452_22419 [Arctium lappa]
MEDRVDKLMVQSSCCKRIYVYKAEFDTLNDKLDNVGEDISELKTALKALSDSCKVMVDQRKRKFDDRHHQKGEKKQRTYQRVIALDGNANVQVSEG